MRYIKNQITTRSISLVVALFVAFMIPGVSNAATITVDEAIDDDPAVDNGSCSLREAITSANTDTPVDSCTAGSGFDDIVFDPSLEGETIVLTIEGFEEDLNATGDLDITDDLTITGPVSDEASSIVIDGNGTDRVIDIHSGEIELSGLTIQNGGLVTRGGGVFARSDNGDLLVENVVIRENEVISPALLDSGADGGGIAIRMPTVIRDSLVTLNSAASSGESIADDARGGGIWMGTNLTPGTIRIENSRIVDNQVESTDMGTADGAGIAIRQGSMGEVEIVDSEISGNTGTGNTRSSQGVGISMLRGTHSIINSTISENLGSGVRVRGAAIWTRESTIEINNVTITENSAMCDGEAPCVGGYLDEVDTTEEITNSIIAGNTATGGSVNEPDCRGDVESQGFNILGDNTGCNFIESTGDQIGNVEGGGSPVDPLLGPLADNGGSTLTHSLLEGSPAIDMGDPADPAGAGTCETEDQRGEMRPFDGDDDGTARCDIGAFELQFAVGTRGDSGCAISDKVAGNSLISVNAILILIPVFVFMRRKLIRSRYKSKVKI